jgi:hypothetical protein
VLRVVLALVLLLPEGLVAAAETLMLTNGDMEGPFVVTPNLTLTQLENLLQ